MKLVPAETTLVVSGAWNPAILNPAWVGHHILGVPEGADIPVQVDMPLTIGVPPRFQLENFTYIARPARLILLPGDLTQPKFDATERAARKILEILRYTPVTGFGLNFEFVEDHPGEADVGAFASVGASLVAAVEEEVEVVERKQIATMRRQPVGEINIASSLKGGLLKVNFNFHYPLTRASDVDAVPVGRFFQDLTVARNLVNAAYGLEEEDE